MSEVQLQLVFNRADGLRNDLLLHSNQLKDQFEECKEYQEIKEQEAQLRAKKLQVAESIIASNEKLVEKIEQMKAELKDERQAVTDVALRDYLAGTTVKVIDSKNNELYPVFSVKFKKFGPSSTPPADDSKQVKTEIDDEDGLFGQR